MLCENGNQHRCVPQINSCLQFMKKKIKSRNFFFLFESNKYQNSHTVGTMSYLVTCTIVKSKAIEEGGNWTSTVWRNEVYYLTHDCMTGCECEHSFEYFIYVHCYYYFCIFGTNTINYCQHIDIDIVHSYQ